MAMCSVLLACQAACEGPRERLVVFGAPSHGRTHNCFLKVTITRSSGSALYRFFLGGGFPY